MNKRGKRNKDKNVKIAKKVFKNSRNCKKRVNGEGREEKGVERGEAGAGMMGKKNGKEWKGKRQEGEKKERGEGRKKW